VLHLPSGLPGDQIHIGLLHRGRIGGVHSVIVRVVAQQGGLDLPGEVEG
jgi:hypothetical protein